MAGTISPENEATLRARIAEHGLQEAESLIVNAATECARLYRVGAEDTEATGGSRYGGLPDLPPGTEWPRNDNGKLLSFLAQINLSEKPSITGDLLPAQGFLYVFTGYDNAFDNEGAFILYADANSKTLLKAEEPEDDAFTEDYYIGLRPHRLEIAAEIELPQWTSDPEQKISDTLEASLPGGWDEYEKRYRALTYSLRRDPDTSAGKLLGQPCWIGYVPEPEETEGKILLLRLDSDFKIGVSFSDAGYLQFFLSPEALAARDFSGVTGNLESS